LFEAAPPPQWAHPHPFATRLIILYHDTSMKFPYATLDYQPGEDPTTDPASYVTSLILILPYLEQDNL
jgi:hypothetical protein